MKNNSTNRDAGFTLVELLVAIAFIAILATAFLPQVVEAASYITPSMSYIDGSTNTVVVATSTNQVSVVAAASTNQFNLSASQLTQTDTNKWPACPLFNSKTTDPFDKLGLLNQYSLMASNGANQTFRYAASPDGSIWVTNAAVIALNTNGAYASGLFVQSYVNTNSLSMPFWCLQAIENPGPAAISNLTSRGSAKPNL